MPKVDAAPAAKTFYNKTKDNGFGFRGGEKSFAFVYFPAMTDVQNQDHHLFILDVAQQPVVSNPIPPKAGAIPFQRFSKMPRVFAPLDPFVEPGENTFLYRPIQFS